jgi:hypothetical protein
MLIFAFIGVAGITAVISYFGYNNWSNPLFYSALFAINGLL